ncbi:hypothetical protein O4H49_06370 [Kiloniella laminariae]|uniref:Uncharacterized protein n=1 Tax=Kiloniella laminariae TaxID=454162 RepID=A0ABT4LH15_9PROT|nr:hypothetical protein [Kiloniella laminariae]MCZ4280393.1 hypothetical protein [Kiloniella laminariae]
MNGEKLPRVDKIICLAGWEPRFLEGVKKGLELTQAQECIIFYAEEFTNKSENNINELEEFCEKTNIKIVKNKLFYNSPLETKKIILSTFNQYKENDQILIDITTMTRELIWMILGTLTAKKINVNYIYWRPETTAHWTSKNSSRPRLVMGRAGVSEYGKPTLVAVTTGFDPSRLDQMVCYFEPEETILFLQEGHQFENHINNIKIYDGYRLGSTQAKQYSIDSYGPDHGLEVITTILSPYLETHNIVLSSFGPKPSALALHKFAQAHPDVALAYTPALEFNEDYSRGIGHCVWGQI